jgi:hypothetical protein
MKQQATEQRQTEIKEYEFNIRNYELMLEKIGDDSELADFRAQVESLLATSRIELKKSKIILQATQDNELG